LSYFTKSNEFHFLEVFLQPRKHPSRRRCQFRLRDR
jgi:hypothetical protein